MMGPMSSLKRPGAPGRIVGIAAVGFVLMGVPAGAVLDQPGR